MLIDTVKQKGYWQEISEEKIERLPKGWKIEVPFANDLETNFVVAARNRVGLEPNSAIYTRLTLDDTSNATTKRYAAGILVRHPITRLMHTRQTHTSIRGDLHVTAEINPPAGWQGRTPRGGNRGGDLVKADA